MRAVDGYRHMEAEKHITRTMERTAPKRHAPSTSRAFSDTRRTDTLERANAAEADAYLRNYPATFEDFTLVDFLTLSDKGSDTLSLPDELYNLSVFCLKLYDCTNEAFAFGLSLPDWSPEESRHRIEALEKCIRTITSRAYHHLREHRWKGTSFKWNFNTILFLVRCNLFRLADCVSPQRVIQRHQLDERNQAAIVQNELLLYMKPIALYTQMELYYTLHRIAQRWHELRRCEDVLDPFLQSLEHRTAHLIVEKHSAAVLDGLDGAKRIRTKETKEHGRTITLYSCAPEFIADVATMFSLFHRGLSIFARLYSYGTLKECHQQSWAQRNVASLVRGFLHWIQNELSTLEKANCRDQLKTTIQRLLVRHGDEERYARSNIGIVPSSPMTVLERSLTPLQLVRWDTKFARKGLGKLLQAESYSSMVRGVTMLRVFHLFSDNRFQFPWWIYNVLLERDFFQREDYVRSVETPLIVQCMGEFNVWYGRHRILYRTVEPERAIIMWTLIVVTEEKGEFSTLHSRQIYGLHALKRLLDLWEQPSEQTPADKPAATSVSSTREAIPTIFTEVN